jgi:hypothetical protein
VDLPIKTVLFGLEAVACECYAVIKRELDEVVSSVQR